MTPHGRTHLNNLQAICWNMKRVSATTRYKKIRWLRIIRIRLVILKFQSQWWVRPRCFITSIHVVHILTKKHCWSTAMAQIYIHLSTSCTFNQGYTKSFTYVHSVTIRGQGRHICAEELLTCLVNQNAILWRTAEIQGFVWNSLDSYTAKRDCARPCVRFVNSLTWNFL